MNHEQKHPIMNSPESRLAICQFIMELESHDLAHWDGNTFHVTGPQGKAWFIATAGNHMNIFFAEYIFEWASGITMTNITVEHGKNSGVSLNFAFDTEDGINEYKIRFPITAGRTSKLEVIETAQIAVAPGKDQLNDMSAWNVSASSETATPVFHIYNQQD